MSIDSDSATPRSQPNYAGAIYGTIISMTVVATASKDDELGSVAIAIWAAVTCIVFWLVHVYADIVAAGYSTPREAVRHAQGAFRNQWPIVQGGMIPAVVMLLAPIGLLNDENASYFAVGAGILTLFATGLFIGSKDNRSWGRRIMIGAVNALFGLLILALKIFVH
ncbi:MAG: hypothetical protein KDB52_06090 [Solirubrobacterales bacterium]|nr:hypothetical protein [Solirubrobacterales bacterium]